MADITKLQKLLAEKAIKLPCENNPIAIHKMTADPCVLIYNDTIYIYGTNDAQQAEFTNGKEANAYNKINTLNVFCSKDMVNWQDCGEIAVAGKNNPDGAAKWASNSWAPAIASKKINGKDKFFLYFADSANGIGVLTADNPLGPFKDPLGKGLITRDNPQTKGIHWLFDPAVFIDDDGTGYLYCGGGVQDDPAHPRSARCVKLGDDMISLASDLIEIDAPWLFEDSGINKINGKYYYSYCSNWADRTGVKDPQMSPIAVIAYMTSDKPLGPFKYQGYLWENPGAFFGCSGNNHHWIFQFKNKWYIAYHAQTTEKLIGFEQGGYRNLFIDELKLEKDGSFKPQRGTKEGVEPVAAFNPYQTVNATTCCSSANIAFTAKHTILNIKDDAWLLVKNADLSKGLETLTATAADNSKGTIRFMIDNWANGTEIASVSIDGKKSKASIKDVKLNGIHNLYLVISGSVELIDWKFN